MIYETTIKRRAEDAFVVGALLLIAAISVFPILHLFALSFSDSGAASAGKVTIFPVQFNLAAYKVVVDDHLFFKTFLNSLKRVGLGVAVQFLITVLMAYPLSRSVNQFGSRNIYMWFVVFTMLFSGGLVPWYMTIRDLHLLDSIWALVLPGAVPVFNVILLMNFFRNLPKELDDAMAIDGAGPWMGLVRMYIPLSLPAIATVTLFSMVGHWNAFFDGLILIHSEEKQPLQTYLNQIVVQMNLNSANMTEDQLNTLMKLSNKTVNSAKIFISMLPLFIIYPFLQRYFIHGITLGSVKE
ncbi:carbohydrate ABC transporter permease [Paenibacillus sp. CF384]|uniref:carbohydrate ABC transporter permease n=1 Tax=Paenibacillus sp. CF384 TaxID=1884382 RepID=UPI0008963FBD|nr:carbohydrate ABC transporter permease [Paenibacillus sp. CF384]SDW48301.1 putative aldouronate transport system permease protein [Paenibacillus sp. CF384]